MDPAGTDPNPPVRGMLTSFRALDKVTAATEAGQRPLAARGLIWIVACFLHVGVSPLGRRQTYERLPRLPGDDTAAQKQVRMLATRNAFGMLSHAGKRPTYAPLPPLAGIIRCEVAGP